MATDTLPSHVSLKWDDFSDGVRSGLSLLQQNGEFVDLSLAADGRAVKVHRAVVAMASPYLKSLILSAGERHPVIYLTDVSFATLCALLEYMYTGETTVPEPELDAFLAVAGDLQVRGLRRAESPAPPEATVPSDPREPLRYTVSGRGSLQLILNRYMYNAFSKSQGGRTRRWRCVDYRDRKCPACCVTRGDAVVRRTGAHTHPFHDKKILAKIRKRAVYSSADPGGTPQ